MATNDYLRKIQQNFAVGTGFGGYQMPQKPETMASKMNQRYRNQQNSYRATAPANTTPSNTGSHFSM